MQDFVLISVPWMLNQQVTTHDERGNIVPEDGEYQRHGADVVFVFAEFLKAKGLLNPTVDVSRRPDLELRFSELTPIGQQFARFALDKWMRSIGRAGLNKPVNDQGLERLWAKFTPKTA
ncbi:hypothetical protein H9L12_00880 [Sphingomonas rhizophila]|uniref:Uncharacterized protein n=1 Tax=Sphingomonas rhizophila TaxID=2071607 RepID=A0A7G9SBL4_9SPHN|nr:hypothetical protein [Sphingomonas rhizophila]QNN65239.1 hypothetical protein H9L12_00880 [Sphingomonas rhizophila]